MGKVFSSLLNCCWGRESKHEVKQAEPLLPRENTMDALMFDELYTPIKYYINKNIL